MTGGGYFRNTMKKSYLSDVSQKIKNMISQGFLHILLGGTLTKVIAFISSIIIVRFVTKEDYAYLSYADNLYSYIYLFACFGLDTAVLKYCINDDKGKNNGYLRFALKFGLGIEAILIVFLLLFTLLFPVAFVQSKSYMFALIAYPCVYFILCLMLSFLRARLLNKEYAYAGIIQTIIVLVVSISLVFFISAYSVVVARYCAAIIVIIYCLWALRKEIVVKEVIYPDREQKKQFLIFGFSLMVANVFSMVMPINESFLVNNLIRETTTTANYKVANLIPQNLTFVTSAIITFYFPYFARMTDKKETWKRAKKVGALTAGIIASIVIVGIVLSPLIIRIAYGNKYNDITGLMTLLWIVYSFNAGFRMLPMNILPAVGYTKFNMTLSIITCIIHFAIDYYCITNYGVAGAAIAGGIVYFLTGWAYWLYLRRKLLA